MGRMQIVSIALLGVWLGWTVFMWLAATRTFRTVDRVLNSPNPQLAAATQPLGHDETRVVLRHLASEINRTLFVAYGVGQILLSVALFFLIWRQTPRDTLALVLAGVMMALVCILTGAITPQIIALGRSIDFLPRNPEPAVMPRFWMLHGAFTGLDGAKLLAGLALLGRWSIGARW
jgi:hypothetical protein